MIRITQNRFSKFKDVLSGEWNFDANDVSAKITLGEKGVFALKLDTYMHYFDWTEAVHH